MGILKYYSSHHRRGVKNTYDRRLQRGVFNVNNVFGDKKYKLKTTLIQTPKTNISFFVNIGNAYVFYFGPKSIRVVNMPIPTTTVILHDRTLVASRLHHLKFDYPPSRII